MKSSIISLIVMTVLSCSHPDLKESKMENAKIIEIVMWKAVEGISPEEAKASATKLNEFVSKQPGFINRKTAMAKDGKFIDLVYWTNLESATKASEKAMKTDSLISIFSKMDQKEMLFQHFEIFNHYPN